MLKSNDLTGIYKEIAELIDVETAIQIHSHFRGIQVQFPIKLYTTEYIRKQILTDYKELSINDIARKYNYSERWIREILKENKSNL